MKTYDVLEKAIQELEKEPTIINDYDGDWAHLDMDKDLILKALELGKLYKEVFDKLKYNMDNADITEEGYNNISNELIELVDRVGRLEK